MKGGRKKRLVPKYSPPAQRVLIAPDCVQEMGSPPAPPALDSSRLRQLLQEVEHELERLGKEVRGSRDQEVLRVMRTKLWELRDIQEGCQRSYQGGEGEGDSARGGSQKVAETVLVVENIKHVLKSAEDVYNYFIRSQFSNFLRNGYQYIEY